MRTGIVLAVAALSLCACASNHKTWVQREYERQRQMYPQPVTPDDVAVASASRRQAEGRCGPNETRAMRDGYTPGDYRCRTKEQAKREDRGEGFPPWQD